MEDPLIKTATWAAAFVALAGGALAEDRPDRVRDFEQALRPDEVRRHCAEIAAADDQEGCFTRLSLDFVMYRSGPKRRATPLLERPLERCELQHGARWDHVLACAEEQEASFEGTMRILDATGGGRAEAIAFADCLMRDKSRMDWAHDCVIQKHVNRPGQ